MADDREIRFLLPVDFARELLDADFKEDEIQAVLTAHLNDEGVRRELRELMGAPEDGDDKTDRARKRVKRAQLRAALHAEGNGDQALKTPNARVDAQRATEWNLNLGLHKPR